MIEELQKLVDKVAQDLSEHCDSVRIFIVVHDNDLSKAYSSGKGNFYSQLGQITEWIERQQEHVRKDAREDNE